MEAQADGWGLGFLPPLLPAFGLHQEQAEVPGLVQLFHQLLLRGLPSLPGKEMLLPDPLVRAGGQGVQQLPPERGTRLQLGQALPK